MPAIPFLDCRSKQFVCSECGKAYSYNKNLRFHIKNVHPSKVKEISAASLKYSCSVCGKTYGETLMLKEHEFREHNRNMPSVPGVSLCPICNKSLSDMIKLWHHLEGDHAMKLESEDLEFPTINEFYVWKDNIEQETCARFVKRTGDRRRFAFKMSYYYCHRSGSYNGKGTGIRNLKSQGSNKMNRLCPAAMRLCTSSDGRCSVNFIKTHVGHENSVNYLTLTLEERNLLASKIAANIPFSIILSEMKNISVDSKESRLRHISRRDLHNIARSFGLKSPDSMKKQQIEDKKLRIIQNRHKNSLQLTNFSVSQTDKGWCLDIMGKSKKTYSIELIDNCACYLFCADCCCCIHKYSCSCVDSAKKGNMCKHIHLINRVLSENDENVRCEKDYKNITELKNGEEQITMISDGSDNEVFCDNNSIETEIVEDANKAVLMKEKDNELLRIEKQNVKDDFAAIVNNLDSFNDLATIRSFLSSLKSIVPSREQQVMSIECIVENA